MRIDAHQHFWQFDPVRDNWIDESMTAIRRNFMPEDLQPILDRAGVEGTIAVQAAESIEETTFLLDLASRYPFILGVVGWYDINDPSLEEKLDEWQAERHLVGFRHILQKESPDYLLSRAFTQSIERLGQYSFTYDLLLYPEHLERAAELVNRFPDQSFVLDHLAKPPIRTGDLDSWRTGLEEIARAENVVCKLSGLVTEADWKDWTPGQINTVIDIGLGNFGPKRLMAGSDWPVCLLAASYDRVWELVWNRIDELTESEQQLILGRTAARVYRL